MSIRPLIEAIHLHFKTSLPEAWGENIVHEYKHIKDIELPQKIIGKIDGLVQQIIDGPANDGIVALSLEGNDPKECIRNGLINLIRRCYSATKDGIADKHFSGPLYDEIAKRVSSMSTSQPSIYFVVNFGPKTWAQFSFKEVSLIDEWRDTDGADLNFGLRDKNEAGGHCRTIYKILPYSRSVIDDFRTLTNQVRCLLASYGVVLRQPMIIRDMYVRPHPLPILPVERIAFGLRGFNIVIPDAQMFRASSAIYQHSRINNIDFDQIKEWYAYLNGYGDRLFRHEMLLSGFSQIILALHDNCIENRLRLASGIQTAISGLEGILLDGKDDRVTYNFKKLGAALYNESAAKEFADEPNIVLNKIDAEKFFDHVYNIRSRASHCSRDISPHFEEPKDGSSLKQLSK